MGLRSVTTASVVVAVVSLVSLCTGQYQQNQTQYQQAPQQQQQQYRNISAPYGNFTSRVGQPGNYSGAPQYPPAYGQGGKYGNATGYQQQDPFAWNWDHEHVRRKSYNQEAQNWVYANIQEAWDFAVNLVGGKNAQYNANAQCGYGGNPYNNEETRLQQQGETLVQTAQWLWDHYPGNKPDLMNAFINLNTKQIPFLADCLAEHYGQWSGTCDQYQRYSRPDQICNNVWFPTWGATNDIGIRITDIWNYEGGIWQKLKYHDWPSYDGTFAPLINEKQLADLLDKSYQAECYQFDITMMHAYWTQFITHDIIKSAPYTVSVGGAYGEQSKPQCCGVADPACYHHSCNSITSPPVSDGYGGYSQGYCMPLSDNVPAVDYCAPIPKDPRNLQTSYIDASQIYGATCEKASQLRSYRKGKLRVNKGLYGLYMRNINLPDDPNPDKSECDTNYPNNDLRCLLSGDTRVNQHPGLTAYQALFLRLHNRLASSCARFQEKNYLSDQVLDEVCYQEVRRYIQSIIQNIFYRDHMPIELGPYVAGHPNYGLSLDYVLPYDQNVHASVWPEYTYAAGRLHTLISHWSQVRDPTKVQAGLQEPDSWYNIYDFLGKGYQLMYSKQKMNELLQNALYDPEQCYDTSFVEELRGKSTNSYAAGLDMFTINIQREREFGIPWYWQLRDFCGMSPVYDWYQANDIWNQVCLETLPQIYGHAKNVEGYIGLICEKPLPGAIVGPTAACILQRQYQNLREGDRWFFDRNGLTGDQLNVVKKFNLGKILCITTNLDYVTENVFRTPNPYSNKYQACNLYDDITEDDLTVLWSYSPATAGDYRTCKDYGVGYGGAASYTNASYPAPAPQAYANSSYSQPQQQSYAAPVQQQSYAAPVQQQSYAAPVQQQSYAAPVQQQSYAAPVQQAYVQAPQQQQYGNSSYKQPAAAAPVYQQAAPQQQTYQQAPQQPAYQAPASQPQQAYGNKTYAAKPAVYQPAPQPAYQQAAPQQPYGG
ncbi:putative Peroxidasin [Hypsibius exemplaris]|uniref:Peroxidasin n=1 Tax=Hypsibius exemplaris TaxID=2072580 RepID=A0A1W0X342_HYPEX|nr:putative Peroxidasin [Hypsibius exemplaris]